MQKMIPYMGDTWIIGIGVLNAAISVCPFTMEGFGPEEKNAEQCWMPWYHRWWIPPLVADKMVRVPVAPGLHLFWVVSQQPRPHPRSQRQ